MVTDDRLWYEVVVIFGFLRFANERFTSDDGGLLTCLSNVRRVSYLVLSAVP